MNILLVDDDSTFLRVMGDALRDRGHHLRVASNGHDALEMLRQDCPDIVISDLEMPEMGGIELMTKAHELAPNLAVVILSAVGDAASSSLAFQHGAYGYLQKPCRVEALIEGIRRLQDSTRRSTVHEVRSLI